VAEGGALEVQVEHARGRKCERCWVWSEKVGTFEVHPAVCERCAAVLTGMEVLR
jgi:isoleucyl-tRNA synthetase